MVKTIRKKTPKKGGNKKPNKKTKKLKHSSSISMPKTSLYCSPFAKKNKVVSNSCLTKDVVNELVTTYNNTHPDEPISETAPSDLQLMEMNKKVECAKDDCLLEKVPVGDNKKTQWKEQLFIPPKPSEWSNTSNDESSWLSNIDISKVLNQYEKAYPYFHSIGPSPVDYDTIRNSNNCVCNALCNFSVEKEWNKGIRKIGIVFNESKDNEDGTHWVAFFIDLEDNFIFFFNSVGNDIAPEMIQFKDTVIEDANAFFSNHKNINMNIINKRKNKKMKFYINSYHHQRSNTECGMYCLYFIISCILRQKDILQDDLSVNKMTEKELVRYFTKQRIPDKLMKQYRDYLFRSSSS